MEELEVVPFDGDHLLHLRSPAGSVSQICLTDPRYELLSPAKALGRQRLRGVGRAPTAATESLLDLLGRVLTLSTSRMLDFAIALDWYKTPVEGLDTWNWPNTQTGELVHRGKYWYNDDPDNTTKLRECGRALTAHLSVVIDQHPLLRSVDAIVAVPGHDARVLSFGSRLAAAVARCLAKRLVRHTGNDLAAKAGATPKELMSRMGHASMRAALIYQHASRERDQAIADKISQNVTKARRAKRHAKGTPDEQ